MFENSYSYKYSIAIKVIVYELIKILNFLLKLKYNYTKLKPTFHFVNNYDTFEETYSI